MKVVNRLREVAESFGDESPMEVHERTKIPYKTCHRLWHNPTDFYHQKTITRLVNAYRIHPAEFLDLKDD